LKKLTVYKAVWHFFGERRTVWTP